MQVSDVIGDEHDRGGAPIHDQGGFASVSVGNENLYF
jgi:hypothetical protein